MKSYRVHVHSDIIILAGWGWIRANIFMSQTTLEHYWIINSANSTQILQLAGDLMQERLNRMQCTARMAFSDNEVPILLCAYIFMYIQIL